MFRDDDGDDVALAARELPQLFEDGVDAPSAGSSISKRGYQRASLNQRGWIAMSVPRGREDDDDVDRPEADDRRDRLEGRYHQRGPGDQRS